MSFSKFKIESFEVKLPLSATKLIFGWHSVRLLAWLPRIADLLLLHVIKTLGPLLKDVLATRSVFHGFVTLEAS